VPERHDVLVLVAGRSGWHRSLAQLVDAALAPLALQRCLGADELLSQAASTGRTGVAIVDASALGVGRDLFDRLRRLGWGTLVVDAERTARHWTTLGAHGAVSPDAPAAEVARLALGIAKSCAHAGQSEAGAPSAPWERLATAMPQDPHAEEPHRGALVCVLGPGGTGTSTLARALAEAAASERRAPAVLLADFARRPHQALLHGLEPGTGGLNELLDCCRLGAPDVASLVAEPPEIGYHVLTGRRTASAWAAWGPFARQAALDALLRTYDVVVADCDGDLEGSVECGSLDVEQRHALQRECVSAADLVVAVGRAGLGGLASLLQLLGDVLRVRGDAAPIGVVLRASTAPRSLGRASRRLVARRFDAGELPGLVLPPISVPEADVERSLIDGRRLPALLVRSCAPLVAVLDQLVHNPEPTRSEGRAWTPVVPGSLGTSAQVTSTPGTSVQGPAAEGTAARCDTERGGEEPW
jgi:hypothetical protein